MGGLWRCDARYIFLVWRQSLKKSRNIWRSLKKNMTCSQGS